MREQVIQIHRLLGDIKRINDQYHTTRNTRYRDMNRIDMSVLGYASMYPELSIKQIRERLGVPQSTLSSSITRLSKKGMIRRVINEADSRSFHLALTESGEALCRSHEEVNIQLAADILATLDDNEERAALIELLSKVVSKMT